MTLNKMLTVWVLYCLVKSWYLIKCFMELSNGFTEYILIDWLMIDWLIYDWSFPDILLRHGEHCCLGPEARHLEAHMLGLLVVKANLWLVQLKQGVKINKKKIFPQFSLGFSHNFNNFQYFKNKILVLISAGFLMYSKTIFEKIMNTYMTY